MVCIAAKLGSMDVYFNWLNYLPDSVLNLCILVFIYVSMSQILILYNIVHLPSVHELNILHFMIYPPNVRKKLRACLSAFARN